MKVINLEDLEHGVRVANYSIEIAKQANLSNKLFQSLYFSGLFHDVGKAYVNQDVLNKPGKLTNHERIQITKHPIYSYEEILSIGYSKEVALNILYHHENWDGTGYPNGLKGQSIPIGARILKIADVFDALTVERPYRGRLTINETLMIMEKEKTTYDPELYFLFTEYLIKTYITKEKKYINLEHT